LKASVIAPHELSLDCQRRWEHIKQHNPSLGSAFFAPGFTVTVGQLRPDARVTVIEDGREMIGFFPFQRRPLGFGRAIGLGLSDFQGVVCEADAGLDFAWLLRACKLRQWSTDHLVDQQAHLITSASTTHESPYIRCEGGLSPYVDQMKSARRPGVGRALRKRSRLANAFGNELSFIWHSGSTATLERLIELKALQCRTAGAYDYTRHRWIRQLLMSLLHAQADNFGGVLSELKVGEQTIAMHFGMRSGNRLHWWLPAYEAEWQSWSPGLALLLFMIEQAPRFGVSQIDLGRDLSRYKREFMNGMDTVHSGVVRLDPTAASATALAARVAELDQKPSRLRWILRPAAGAMRVAIRRMRFQ
jgi:CelD/BcsL family acetyltransferase involved in cellulose biosynthesis